MYRCFVQEFFELLIIRLKEEEEEEAEEKKSEWITRCFIAV